MAHAYSLDVRQKVIAFIQAGGSKREASRIFQIGEDTIYRWIRRNKIGQLAATRRTHYATKVDPEALKAHIESNPDHTLHEIGSALQLGIHTVWKWLRRLHITRKKKRYSTQNVVSNNANYSKIN